MKWFLKSWPSGKEKDLAQETELKSKKRRKKKNFYPVDTKEILASILGVQDERSCRVQRELRTHRNEWKLAIVSLCFSRPDDTCHRAEMT